MKVRATRWIISLGALGCSTSAEQTGTDAVTATITSPASSDSLSASASDGTFDPSGNTDTSGTTGPLDPTTSAGTNNTSPTSVTSETTDTGDPPPASCDGAGGPAVAAEPVLSLTLKDRWEEAWLGSAAVADLDGDGMREIVVPRGNALIAWSTAGEVLFKTVAEGGRIWASPIVADFRDGPELEIAFAARDRIYMLDHLGSVLPGFPVTWEDELRALAAGDVDGDGALDLVAALPTAARPTSSTPGTPTARSSPASRPTRPAAPAATATASATWPAASTRTSPSATSTATTGRPRRPHDNAYTSIHSGTGAAFDAADIFPVNKTPGVRYLHVLAEAMQGYADDEDTALQAHFTNTAPAIADIDGDGQREVILLASVQNAAQTNREQGVAVWVVGHDAARRPGFDPPVHLP